jgi:hypothetical protein
MESLITDIYITSFGAHETRDYRRYLSDQDSLKPAVLYGTLLSLFHDAV